MNKKERERQERVRRATEGVCSGAFTFGLALISLDESLSPTEKFVQQIAEIAKSSGRPCCAHCGSPDIVLALGVQHTPVAQW